MSKGLVSVVMPGYNCADSVKRAIDSLLAQCYQNWELIYVDDKSSDESFEIVKSIADSRIKAIRMNENSGSPVRPRNIAIREAKGQYIAFLDSDDTWEDNKLSLQIRAMIDSNLHASHGYYNRVDQYFDFLNLVICPERVTYKKMLSTNYIGNLTGIYDCSILGKFLQKEVGHEDYLMWLNILSKTDSVGIKSPLGSYTVSGTSVSSNKIKAMEWHYNILRNELGFNRLKSFHYFSLYLFNAISKRI